MRRMKAATEETEKANEGLERETEPRTDVEKKDETEGMNKENKNP